MTISHLKKPTKFEEKPYLQGWSTRTVLEINNVGCNVDLQNQQLLVNIDPNFWSFTDSNFKTDGSDIRFTTVQNQIIPHYLVKFSRTGHILKAYIKTDVIKHGQKYLFVYYGNPSAISTSDSKIMYRYQPESVTTNLVRFNDSVGNTASNVGSDGGSFDLNGGYTWNTSDMLFDSNKSLTLDGISGYVSKTGMLDSWPSELLDGIWLRFDSITGEQHIFNKINRLKGTDEGDLLRLYKRSDHKLELQLNVGTQNAIFTGTTVLTQGSWNHVCFRYIKRTPNPTFNSFYIEVWLNGNKEILTTGALTIPTVFGNASPFIIGCKVSNVDGATKSNFASITVQDFISENKYPSVEKIGFIAKNQKFYPYNQRSKLVKSNVPEFGGISPTQGGVPFEPVLMWDDNKWKLWYTFLNGTGNFSIWYRETTDITINTNNNWSAPEKVFGEGGSGYSGKASNSSLVKFGNKFYIYYRDSVPAGAGPIWCAESTDGKSFTNRVQVLANAASGFGYGGYFNTEVVYHEGYYWMMVESKAPYRLGWARCLTPNGTFQLYGTNPIPSLIMGTYGNEGGPCLNKIAGKWHLTHHGNVNGVLPMPSFTAYSTDLLNWYRNSDAELISLTEPNEYDQAADNNLRGKIFSLLNYNNPNAKSVIIYNAVNNDNLAVQIQVAVYEADLVHLVTDFNIKISGQKRVWETETNQMIGLGLTNDAATQHAEIVDRRIKDLKGRDNPLYETSDIWDMVFDYHIMIGGNANLHKINAKDPLGASWEYKSGCTHSDKGIIFNGTTDYLDTKLNVSLLPSNDLSFAWHVTEGTPTGFLFGAGHNLGAFGSYNLGYAFNNYALHGQYNTQVVMTTAKPVKGYHAMSRTAANLLTAYMDAMSLGTATAVNTYTSQPNQPIYMGGRSWNGLALNAPLGVQTKVGDFLCARGLTAVQILNNHRSVQAKEKALGRL